MKKSIILIIILFSAVCANAQELLSLEKCREMTLKNNTKVRNAQLSVEAAEQTKKEAFTKYFPNVSATGAGLIFNEPLMMQTVETGYPAPNDKAVVEMFKNGVIGGVMATQPVFAGGQIVNGNRLARAGVEANKLQKQMTDNEALLATERYFWQLVSLKEKMKTIAQVETMLHRVHSDVSVAVEAGLTNRNDRLRVELEQNRLAANRLTLENGIQVLKMAFGQHIGVAGNFDIQPPDFTNLASPLADTDYRMSLQNRPEYRLLEKSVDVAKLQVKMETAKNLPTVAIGAGYNYVNFDNGKPAEMEKNLGLAFVTVSVPVSGWWGGAHAIKKKKFELQAAENTRRENTELLLIQMRQLAAGLDEAYQQVLLAQKSIAVAEENVRISEDHYRAGISILSDLLDAQNLLQQSRDRYVEAATDYCVKQMEYRQAVGSGE
ncbi:MAG: TolC family protein [Dysgonamonadaceae bacterium]|jgi:outer membrane protein TolC|nr:TolC family protein [Dysgonamonadaceae bacterium]